TQSPSRLPNNVDRGSNAGFEALEPDNVEGRGWRSGDPSSPRFAKYDGIQKRQGLLTLKACPPCSPQIACRSFPPCSRERQRVSVVVGVGRGAAVDFTEN